MKIAIIGLGYVGLPLAVEFSKKYKVIGFDINRGRIKELKSGKDSTLEITDQELKDAIHLSYTSNVENIKKCNIPLDIGIDFIINKAQTYPKFFNTKKEIDLKQLTKLLKYENSKRTNNKI